MVPKAELHVHLEGTAPPDLVRRIAERNGLRVPEGVFATPDRFAWRDFLDFLQTYDMAASVMRTPEDYRDITYEYLASCAADGAIYVELIASPDHAALVGLSDEEHIAGIAAGIDAARAEHGIEARILLTCIRNFGVEQALRIATYAAGRPHPYVVGFQMAGDEAGYPPGPFAEAYAVAAAAGLGCSVHAGEWAGAESVRAALDLPVTRIGHGVRAIEDPALVAEIAERGSRPRVLPDEQRRARGLRQLRDPPPPRPARGRRPRHPRLRRPALLRRERRRRVRGRARALRPERRGAGRPHPHRDRGELRGTSAACGLARPTGRRRRVRPT